MTSKTLDGQQEPVPHEHELRLVAVHQEDGASTREFRCETCQAVWFS
jgi:hypothetical protein